jgi:hypothetical protein
MPLMTPVRSTSVQSVNSIAPILGSLGSPLGVSGAGAGFGSSKKDPYAYTSYSSSIPYRRKHFEFVIADIEEIVPVVKAMHQLDFCEGMLMSIQAESRQNESADPGSNDLNLLSSFVS